MTVGEVTKRSLSNKISVDVIRKYSIHDVQRNLGVELTAKAAEDYTILSSRVTWCDDYVSATEDVCTWINRRHVFFRFYPLGEKKSELEGNGIATAVQCAINEQIAKYGVDDRVVVGSILLQPREDLLAAMNIAYPTDFAQFYKRSLDYALRRGMSHDWLKSLVKHE